MVQKAEELYYILLRSKLLTRTEAGPMTNEAKDFEAMISIEESDEGSDSF
jgi:hypothetical protein